MLHKIKKVILLLVLIALSLQSFKSDIYANSLKQGDNLLPGEVTQNKSTKWVDYANGIAEISFDVRGKNAEEPLDVAIAYDNSGSMQTSDFSNGQGSAFLNSRWHYAREAAKSLSNNLLQNSNNHVAFIPFSDFLINGDNKHTDKNTLDFFETHKLVYDEAGNPDITTMTIINIMYGEVILANGSQESLHEFYKNCEESFGLTKDDLAEADNMQNALVPFTNDSSIVNKAIDSLYPSGAGQTNYEVALKQTQEYFASSKNKKVLLMISDGKPNYGGDSIAIANALKSNDVTIYTVGTGIKESDATVLKAIASKEDGNPLYTSANPSDLNTVLEELRKQFEVAADNAEIMDEINTEYFEYYSDETHFPTVDNVAVGSDNLIISPDKAKITWKIGDIRETTKTLRFYVKVKTDKLNDSLFNDDNSLLNTSGDYKTNKDANLIYRDVNTDNMVNEGHEMQSPSLKVATAKMKTTYYLSDEQGNLILDSGKKITLKKTDSEKKALNIEYTFQPDESITIDGETYYIYKDDNKQINKTFTENDSVPYELEYRYVKQINVIFDTNGYGDFQDGNSLKKVAVDHKTMTVPTLPSISNIPDNKVLIGWNTDRDGLGLMFDSTTEVSKDMTVYAQWKDQNKYSVIFKDGNKVLGKDEVYPGDTATAPSDVEKEGYTFIKWDEDFTNVQSDLVVNAQYKANTYVVKFDGNGQSSGTMSDQSFIYDQKQALTKNAFTKENHTFTGWLYNGKTYTDEEAVKNLIATEHGEVTLIAQWKENEKYTVTFKDGNEILGSSQVYAGEDAIAPSNPVKAGFIFVGWDKTFTNVYSNLTVSARWQGITTEQPETPETPNTPVLPITPQAPTPTTPPTVPNVPVDNQVQSQPDNPNQQEPAQPEQEVVPDNETPLAKGNGSSSWALINLISCILTILLVVAILLGKRKKDEESEEENVAYKRRKWTMVASVLVGLVSTIAFILTENVFLPMIFVDKWTLLMIAILLVQVVVLAFAKKWKKTDKEEVAVNA